MARTTAQPGDNRTGVVNAAAPSQIPPSALLTGHVLQTASVDGVDVRLEGSAGAGFELVFHNPGSAQRESDFEVDCVQEGGSPMARVRLPPMVVHTEHVHVKVLAGATVRHRLEADVAAVTPDANTPAVFRSFSTTSFRLRRGDTDAPASILAVLRSSSDTAANAG